MPRFGRGGAGGQPLSSWSPSTTTPHTANSTEISCTGRHRIVEGRLELWVCTARCGWVACAERYLHETSRVCDLGVWLPSLYPNTHSAKSKQETLCKQQHRSSGMPSECQSMHHCPATHLPVLLDACRKFGAVTFNACVVKPFPKTQYPRFPKTMYASMRIVVFRALSDCATPTATKPHWKT